MQTARTLDRTFEKIGLTSEYDGLKDRVIISNSKGQQVFVTMQMVRTSDPRTIIDFVFNEFESYSRSSKDVANYLNLYNNTWTGTTTTGGYTQQLGNTSDWAKYQEYEYQVQFPATFRPDGLPEQEEERMQVKLTLKEAQYLETLTEQEPMLKDILAKIEEGADFQIVVSFRKDED